MAKRIVKIQNVTIYYGSTGIGMVRDGGLAKLGITGEAKMLIASQIEGLHPSGLSNSLELLVRFEMGKLGVNITSCGTFLDF